MKEITLTVKVTDKQIQEAGSLEMLESKIQDMCEKVCNPAFLLETWTVEDVYAVLAEADLPCHIDIADLINQGVAQRVLDVVKDSFDANIGINWESINTALDEVIDSMEIEEKEAI